VVRWAWRLFRREWRQQILVLALLAFAVSAAIGGAAAAYSVVPSRDAEFGTANRMILLRGGDPETLRADVAAIEERFGTVDVIGHRRVPIPGSVETLEFRYQNPNGAYGAPMLALLHGRYPAGAGEVAITDAVAATLEIGVGDLLAIDGSSRTVVGLVENPGDLADEFALVPPSQGGRADSATILVNGSAEEAGPLPAGVDGESQRRGETEKSTAAVLVLGLSTVAMLLVSLIAAAGFVVVAQRRIRQLGMLAAMGATQQHLRLVMVANGVVVGAVAAVIGAAVALLAWIGLAARLETAAGHRIDRFDMPWWLIVAGMLLAVATATAAAWWPARAAARIPITLALSARSPRPKPARQSAVAALLLIVIGVGCLAAGVDPAKEDANVVPLIAGTLATTLGMLLLCPAAIQALAACGVRLPVAFRIALRDLARYRARSGAALAAISLGLAISVAIVVIAAAAKYGADEGNLSDRQLLVRVGDAEPLIPQRTPADLGRLQAQVDRFAGTLEDAQVVALDAAVDPRIEEGRNGQVVRPAAVLGRHVGEGTLRDVGVLYVATPELLSHVGVDRALIAPGIDVLTPQQGAVYFANMPVPKATGSAGPIPIAGVAPIDVPGYSSGPRSFITPDSLRRHGWEPARAGWLVESGAPLTSSQLATARRMAAESGLTIEARRTQNELAVIGTGATIAGALLALGVLAMTIGLIRMEAAGDLRILTATGATSTTRRTLTAATGGALALLGVILGTAAAYLALAAGYSDDLSALAAVPVAHLASIIVGIPLLAAAAGWLLAGREPSALAGQLD
jgi:putative ABC transport system permease protein